MRTKLLVAALVILGSGAMAGPAAAKTTKVVRVYEGNVLVSASLNWLSSSFTEYACGGEARPSLSFHGKGSASIQLRARKVKVTYTWTRTTFRTIFVTDTVTPFPLTGTWQRNASYNLEKTGDYTGCPSSTGNIPPPETSGCGKKTVTEKSNKVTAQVSRGKKGRGVGMIVTPAGDDLFGGGCPDESTRSAVLLLSAKGSLDDMKDGEKSVTFRGTEGETLKTDDLTIIGPSGKTGGGRWDVTWSATFRRVK